MVSSVRWSVSQGYGARVGERYWRTRNDVRDGHAEMDGKWARPGESFVVEYPERGTRKESVPGDSEPGIGCRCVQLLRDREEVDDADYAGDGTPN